MNFILVYTKLIDDEYSRNNRFRKNSHLQPLHESFKGHQSTVKPSYLDNIFQ